MLALNMLLQWSLINVPTLYLYIDMITDLIGYTHMFLSLYSITCMHLAFLFPGRPKWTKIELDLNLKIPSIIWSIGPMFLQSCLLEARLFGQVHQSPIMNSYEIVRLIPRGNQVLPSEQVIWKDEHVIWNSFHNELFPTCVCNSMFDSVLYCESSVTL